MFCTISSVKVFEEDYHYGDQPRSKKQLIDFCRSQHADNEDGDILGYNEELGDDSNLAPSAFFRYERKAKNSSGDEGEIIQFSGIMDISRLIYG